MPLSSIACPANGRWRARSSRLLHNSIIVRVTLNSPAAMAMRREVLNACRRRWLRQHVQHIHRD